MRCLLLLALLALVLVGCGGSAGDPASEQGGSRIEIAGQDVTPTGVSSSSPASTPASSAQSAEAAEVPGRASATAAVDAPDELGVTVWVTAEKGARVLRNEHVRSGLTAIQTVDLVAELETNYGGRYVTSIDGLSGDLDGQEDWFFLINGIEPDIGAAEIKVGDGDIVWWDHRSWLDGAAHPAIAIGAFPRPFHRGWKGAVRPVDVVAPAALAPVAAELEAFLGINPPDDVDAEPHRFMLEVRPELDGAELSATMGSRNGSAATFVLAGNETAVRAAARALLTTPGLVERRYVARFDLAGQVVEP